MRSSDRQLTRTRDMTTWQATMARRDADERIAREPLDGPRRTAQEIVEYSRSRPRLWEESGAVGRQAPVVAIFARLDVLGFEQLEYELTPDAIDLGLDAALPRVMDLTSQIGEFGRGERACTSHTDLRIDLIRLVPHLAVTARSAG
jgi:hypothetical protein